MVPLTERPLPEALSVLHELATDLYWSWNHCGDKLWEHINPEVWAHTQNPVSVLQLTTNEQLQHLASNNEFVQQLQKLAQARQDYLTKPSWYDHHYPNQPLRGIAYFSMEFGLCEALPLYAGGLGMLAGDYLKTASDLGVPLVGIGLLYQQGYFRQTLDSNGWQQETYLYNDPTSLPIRPLLSTDGTWQHIDTQFLSRRVRFRVWCAQVGRVTLYLLDSNDPCNQPGDRGITSSLYGGGSELRLVQEMALGICGWRLIETLGLDIDICHLNEGHAAFATLERIRSYCAKHKVDFWEGLWGTRIGNIFTTHTPVAAGFDHYSPALLRQYLTEYCQRIGVSIETIIGLGQSNSQDQQDDQEPFNMAYLAMRTCARSNAVSQLHGKVSQHIFQPLFPRWPEREVPVNHVTNGVHVPTWDSPWADHEWTQLFGKERWRGDLDTQTPANLASLSDIQLSQMATHSRAALVNYVRQRLVTQWRQESPPLNRPQENDVRLDPNILTLGFARRFAEYKRSDLLLRDPERLARILCNSRYPVQLLVAGKAHPADNAGKQALQHWHQFVHRPDVRQHVVLLEDYDIALAQQLVQGVDLWVNTPRRPWEACGTSGMKVLVNGGLNLSTLDGWWAEAYAPDVGWALGDVNEKGDGLDHGCENDAQDAEQLYQLLENEVIPLFYKHNNKGLPADWLARMRASMAQLTTRFSSNRMITEYIDYFYLPAAAGFSAREQNDGALAKDLQQWQQQLQKHWHEIHLGATEIKADSRAEVTVYLGDIHPETIAVQAIADVNNQQPAVTIVMELLRPVDNALNAYRYSGQLPNDRAPEDFTMRVISAHFSASIPTENMLIYWQVRN